MTETVNHQEPRTALALLGPIVGGTVKEPLFSVDALLKSDKVNSQSFNLFFKQRARTHSELIAPLKTFWCIQDYVALDNPYGNLIAACAQALNFQFGIAASAKRGFEQCLLLLKPGPFFGPFSHFFFNSGALADRTESPIAEWIQNHPSSRGDVQLRERGSALQHALASRFGLKGELGPSTHAQSLRAARSRVSAPMSTMKGVDDIVHVTRQSYRIIDRTFNEPGGLWQAVLGNPRIHRTLLDLCCATFGLRPAAHWFEALRVTFLPRIPHLLRLFDPKFSRSVELAFLKGPGEAQIYGAAWLLLLALYEWLQRVSGVGSLCSHS